jgi:hypothetical protein
MKTRKNEIKKLLFFNDEWHNMKSSSSSSLSHPLTAYLSMNVYVVYIEMLFTKAFAAHNHIEVLRTSGNSTGGWFLCLIQSFTYSFVKK